jgi:hypothetical protein
VSISLRTVVLIILGYCMFGVADETLAQSAPQPSYRAQWVALPNMEALSLTVKEKDWVPILTFRPAQTLVLVSPAIELGKRNARLDAGTLMVPMDATASIVCQLERPKGRYFIGCIEDFDKNGSYDGFFLLNHANPFLFSALRQPRHKKYWNLAPTTLRAATNSQVPEVKMVFLYDNRAELSQVSRFQLCVLREGHNNIWDDATHLRGCLPTIAIKDGGEAVSLDIYGRKVVVSALSAGLGQITISAQAEAVGVEL